MKNAMNNSVVLYVYWKKKSGTKDVNRKHVVSIFETVPSALTIMWKSSNTTYFIRCIRIKSCFTAFTMSSGDRNCNRAIPFFHYEIEITRSYLRSWNFFIRNHRNTFVIGSVQIVALLRRENSIWNLLGLS